MKTIDVNIASPVVTNNVQLISKIGSNLGNQFFKAEVRMAWQGGQKGFEADKLAIETGEKKGFILNRSPKRLLAKNFLIAGTMIVKNPMNDDEIGIAINPHEDGTCDLFLPIAEDTLQSMNKTTVEAIAEAIKGKKDHFFLDAKTLVKVLNDATRREITYLEEHIQACQKMVGTLKGDIVDNDNKARRANENWINSALKTPVDMPGGAGTIITVNKTED